MSTNIALIPIVKILDRDILKILLEDDKLPEFIVDNFNDTQPIEYISNVLYQSYNIKSQWIDIYFVGLTVFNNNLRIYYSTFVPKDFLNESVYNKFNATYSKLPIHDGQQIQQSFAIRPY